MKISTLMLLVLLSGISISLGFAFSNQDPPGRSSTETAKADGFEPVDNMHHFMEYISEPSYKALKASLAQKPVKRSDWAPIKSAALILAESTTLVSDRCEDTDAKKVAEWKKISKDVFSAAKDLYGAARRLKFEDSKKYYSLMIDNCNKCHEVFANGKHQLEK